MNCLPLPSRGLVYAIASPPAPDSRALPQAPTFSWTSTFAADPAVSMNRAGRTVPRYQFPTSGEGGCIL
ncbi:hypothetical protein HYQ46_001125 [Verticillium longisporum]|nr:hypothetical protein HYQ46_001125 [Verticillium longisporum]